jgi:hypothetical protein
MTCDAPDAVYALYSALQPGALYKGCQTDIAPGSAIPSPWDATKDPCKAWTALTVVGSDLQAVTISWTAPTTNVDGTVLL